MTIGFDEIRLQKTTNASVVTLVIKGKLAKEDYEEFVPQLDWLIEKNGAINLLVELVGFKGWTLGALWEDTKFAFKHFADVHKLAVVGKVQLWEKGMIGFAKPFSRAKIRYFESADKQEALKWLTTTGE